MDSAKREGASMIVNVFLNSAVKSVLKLLKSENQEHKENRTQAGFAVKTKKCQLSNTLEDSNQQYNIKFTFLFIFYYHMFAVRNDDIYCGELVHIQNIS